MKYCPQLCSAMAKEKAIVVENKEEQLALLVINKCEASTFFLTQVRTMPNEELTILSEAKLCLILSARPADYFSVP